MADNIVVDRSTPTPLMAGRMLRADAVAELLDIELKRVYILAREGILPCVRVGRQVRFNRADLEAWAARGGTGYPDEAQ